MAGTSGYGTTLNICESGGELAAIGEIISIDGPTIKVTKIESSHTLSADAYKEFIAGMIDGGDIKVELNWTPTSYGALKDFADARGLMDGEIEFPDGSIYEFPCIVTEVGHKTAYDDKTTFPVTLSQTGKGIFTEAEED